MFSARSRHFSLFGRAKIGASAKSEKCLERAENLTETLATQARSKLYYAICNLRSQVCKQFASGGLHPFSLLAINHHVKVASKTLARSQVMLAGYVRLLCLNSLNQNLIRCVTASQVNGEIVK